MSEASRRAAEEIIRKRLGSVYTSRATMDDCLDKLEEWRDTALARAVEGERTRVDYLLRGITDAQARCFDVEQGEHAEYVLTDVYRKLDALVKDTAALRAPGEKA